MNASGKPAKPKRSPRIPNPPARVPESSLASLKTLATTERDLAEAALAARRHAYAPYSKFLVGAAVRGSDGQIFSGVNIENASYGLTLCAERAAIAAAVAAGERRFPMIAIASSGGVTPCGACRQFLREFGADLGILLIDIGPPPTIRRFTLEQLLPVSFSGSSLKSTLKSQPIRAD